MEIIKVTSHDEYFKFYNLFKSVFVENIYDLKDLNQILNTNIKNYETINYMAIEKNTVVGIISATVFKEQKRIYINLIGVLEEYRRRQVATSLLNQVFYKSYSIYFSGCPNGYLVPGLDEIKYPVGVKFFKSKGFIEIDRAISMEINLTTFNFSNYLNNKKYSYEIKEFNDYYYLDVLELLSCSDHKEWKDVFIKAYIDNKKENLGYVATINNKVIGFAGFNIVSRDKSRFGPIYVSDQYRGKQIGKNLTLMVLEKQKELGCKKSYFLWGENNSIALKMYEKIGFLMYSNMSVLRCIN